MQALFHLNILGRNNVIYNMKSNQVNAVKIECSFAELWQALHLTEGIYLDSEGKAYFAVCGQTNEVNFNKFMNDNGQLFITHCLIANTYAEAEKCFPGQTFTAIVETK